MALCTHLVAKGPSREKCLDSANSPPLRSDLHQFPDQRPRGFPVDAQWPASDGGVVLQDRFQLVQRRQVLTLPEQANRNLLAPFVAALHGVQKISRVVRLILELAGALLEKLVR